MLRKIISSVVVFVFTACYLLPPSHAQSISTLNLPTAGAMVHLSEAFVPVLLKGMTLHPDDPLRLDFIVDNGNTNFNDAQLRQESDRLVKYFLASMTVPKNDLWVNLSPYEKDRIIPTELSKTQLGRDLLAQDYLLKQLTATLMSPEDKLGETFWKKVRQEAKAKFGTDDVPTNTFNKVWIMPESAVVYENGNTVYIVESKLKVMLDSDYEALQSAVEKSSAAAPKTSTLELQTQIVREVIIPAIEKEVNEGKNFAPLRQMYYSLILAKWYKDTVKNSLLSNVYIDRNKVSGVDDVDQQTKDKIYDQYMSAYKKGVYNVMKEEYDAVSQQVIPRQYFSGGFKDQAITVKATANAALVRQAQVGKQHRLELSINPLKDQAQLSDIAPILAGVGMGYKPDMAMLNSMDQFVYYTAIGAASLFGLIAARYAYKKVIYNKKFNQFKTRYGQENIDVFMRLIERQPKRAKGSLVDYAEQAVQLKKEGYDFKVVFFPEAERISSSETPDWFPGKVEEWRLEVLKIEKGEPLNPSQSLNQKKTINDNAQLSDVGGIDMNTINVERQGKGMKIQFDSQVISPLLNEQIQGFAPVIINITPLPSIMPLLGLDRASEYRLSKSAL